MHPKHLSNSGMAFSWLCADTRSESSEQQEVCSALPESSIVYQSLDEDQKYSPSDAI